MIRSRLGLRVITLCLALAGLMAINASLAQAETGAYWEVNGKKLDVENEKFTNELKVELEGKLENNHGTLLGTIAGVGIHILCTGVTFASGKQNLYVGGKVEGKVKFVGCKVLRLKEGKAEALPPCDPAGNIIETTEGKGLLSLHELKPSGVKDIITVLEPVTGTLFASFATGSECAFGEKITIGGKLAIVDTENAETNKSVHKIKEFAPLTTLFLNGNVNNKATIDGVGEVNLAGAHSGLSWSGHPA